MRFGERWSDQYASRAVLLLAAAIGLASFGYYYAAGLTTAHYDAKARLVLARSILDSTRPDYAQIGAHWLPLTHLLLLPFVMLDSQYRSAVIPSLFSVLSFALSAWLVFRISSRMTGSTSAGLFAGILLPANANLQYLQSCPLTEPISMVLMLAALDSLLAWREGAGATIPWRGALCASLGALCRYEGWYLLAGVFLVLAWDFWSRYRPRRQIVKAALAFAGMFAVPAAAHFTYIYWRIGDSFIHRVIRGRSEPYETYKRPLLSAIYHLGELTQVASVLALIAAFAGLGYCLARYRPLRRWVPLLLLWTPSLVNISALYWGLIYRVRYSILLVPAVAIFGSLVLQSARAMRRTLVACSLVALALPWLSWQFPREWVYRFFFPGPGLVLLPATAVLAFMAARAAAEYRWPLLVLLVIGMQLPALEGESRPILAETLEHEYIEAERRQVLAFLRANYEGSRILIDMGRVAPLVYDSGFPVREFVYSEGDRILWHRARAAPHREVGWICAERGDEVWIAAQVDPHWVDRYSLAVETENYRIYRLNSEDRDALLTGKRSE